MWAGALALGDLGWKGQLTPEFLPEEFHGQRSLEGCSPWGHKRTGHDLATKQKN